MSAPASGKGPVLILGARSDMGLAIARRFAKAGHPVQLAARNAAEMEGDRADIALRHQVDVSLHEYDALAIDALEGFVASLPDLPQIAVCAVGTMGAQEENERNLAQALRDMRSNYEGPALTLGVLANAMAARGSGTLIGISSVAGLRGRATNYVYGSAKAGFSAFLSGLRNRLAKQGVHVVTVMPGFVATRMTEGMDLPAKLTAQPDEVAEKVYHAAHKQRNLVYVKPIWQLIMLIIRHIPEGIFKKMKI